MTSKELVLWLSAALVVASGCGRPPPPTGLDIPRGQAPSGFPAILVTTAGPAPALFAGADATAPAFGYVDAGVRARVDGPIQGQRIPVTIGGDLVVHAWAAVDRLVTFTSRRGRVAGTPTFVSVGDPVSLVGRDGDGPFRVIVRPRFSRPDLAGVAVGYTGTLDAAWLGGEDRGHAIDPGLNEGRVARLPAGQEVPLYDRPDGSVIVRLPALDPPLEVTVLRERDGWSGVRVGDGPFLVGFVRGPLEATSGGGAVVGAGAREPGALPLRIARETGPLLRVAAGTRVTFYGEEVARLRTDGWARELSARQAGMVDVFVAVDDAVAIRGLVPASSVRPAEPRAQPTRGDEPAQAAPTP